MSICPASKKREQKIKKDITNGIIQGDFSRMKDMTFKNGEGIAPWVVISPF